MPLLELAEQHARAGNWVAVMLAYEAGGAFDQAFPRRSPSPGVPLAWFGAFGSREHVEPLSHPSAPAMPLAVQRRGGTDWYMDGVAKCRNLIAQGSAYQVNLTDRFDGLLVGSPLDLYRSMAAAQGGAFIAYLDLGDVVIVSASPELFFRIEGDVVTARPMKGTARRRTRSDDDERAGRELVESDKERAENVMIVDLLRNDLSRLASVGSVSVPSLFVAERYETVWQLTSTVQAEIEPWPRGVYCGAIGLIAANRPGDPARRPDATFNVAIRSAVIGKCSGSLEFGAGGGVTWSSEPASEDAELEAKAVVLTEHRPEFQLLETLRVEGTHLVNFDEHLQRLGSSARYFGFGFDLGAIRKVCGVAIEERPSGDARRMRILLSRTGGLHVELHPLEPASTTPLRLAVAPLSVRSDDVFCCHKTTNRSNYERISALHPGADDVLLANERGEVTETCRANLLVRRGDRWFTPPLASGGLAGIDAFALVSSLRGRRCATVHI